MTKKNKEGKSKRIRKNEIKKLSINALKEKSSKFSGGMTLKDIENKKGEKNKIQNLTSVLIFVSGLFVGSLFVDSIQLITRSGYSERALRQAEVFEIGDKTWVAYREPVVKVDVLTVEDEEDCLTCNGDEILVWMKKFIPTMAINKVSEKSDEGMRLIEKYQLKTVPSFVFDSRIEETSFFKEEDVQEIFDKKENGLVLNSLALGIPAGKYIEIPGEKSGDIIIGKKDAKVKLTTFFDFQCQYSKIFYEAVKEARNSFNAEQLVLVYKNFPLDLQGQGISASLAGECAYKQGRFEEMADLLFANQEKWGKATDFKIFDQYALRIGLDKKQFDECVNSESSKDLILELIEQGEEFGISGTPASFAGDEFLNGIFQKEDLIEAINKKLN